MSGHGTRGGYARHLRDREDPCDACRAANTERARAYRLRKAREGWGEPTVMVDAEPARAHVRALNAAGVGWKRVARAAGLGDGTIVHLLYGVRRGVTPARQVRRTTAEAILALNAEDCLADGADVDASGTRRRLQALIAAGWTQTALARHLGIAPTNFARLLASKRAKVWRARQVRDLYSALWDQGPPEDVYAEHARALARERRWPPPAGWDDDLIDLPEEELAAELERRAAAMDDAEVRACHTAYYKHGDLSPLVVAGARECSRRTSRKHYARTRTGAVAG